VETYTKRILCVDDDPSTLKLRQLLLEAAGHFVLTAASGAQALGMLAEGTDVDLVLLDYMMPEMNGDELAGKLRERYPQLRLVAVSASEELPASLLDRVDQHVHKEHGPEALLAAVSTVLDRPSKDRHEPRVQQKTVLCVEDEQLQLQLRKALFESAGFRVLQARTAEAAMELFRAHPVDAVIMDYWLSGTNGTALAEAMKLLRPRVPIVMLSGFSSLPGEGAVVDAWLRKAAVEPEDVVNEIRRLIVLRSPKTSQ